VAPVNRPLVLRAIKMGIDILEGNKVNGRAYSGFPLLHYNETEKLKKVEPVRDDRGRVIGGEVQVHQLWYDSHIESDTSPLDVHEVLEVPWIIVDTIDVLNRGQDDFSPFVTYQDIGPRAGMPLADMDTTSFPMHDGTRTAFRVKMAPGKYFNLIYTPGMARPSAARAGPREC
jgi:hypothetical protein